MAKRKQNGKPVCTVCEENPIKYPVMELCANCYQYLWHWKGKSLKRIMKRQRQVEIYEKRLAIIGADKGANR